METINNHCLCRPCYDPCITDAGCTADCWDTCVVHSCNTETCPENYCTAYINPGEPVKRDIPGI